MVDPEDSLNSQPKLMETVSQQNKTNKKERWAKKQHSRMTTDPPHTHIHTLLMQY